MTGLLGIPSSSSYALIGGLYVVAAIAGFGIDVVHMEGMVKVFLGLFIFPLSR
jgi:phosphate/sulfate permease